MIQRERARMDRELNDALRAYTAVIRAELRLEVETITERIDAVHKRALRELTARAERSRTV
jgi:phage host-nuclease inhibitor protein Gam